MVKMDCNDLEKVSGGAIWQAKCEKCGKDLTCNKGDILAITKDMGSWTRYVYSCPQCAELDENKNKGFKHLFEKVESKDPVSGETVFNWKKLDI